MSWYKTGTVSLTNGNANVAGNGTQWVTNASIGEGFVGPDGRTYEITNIGSDTAMTISPVYQGATAAGQGYQILPARGRIPELIAETGNLIASFVAVRDGVGAGLFPDGNFGVPSVRFTSDQDTGIYRASANRLAVSASDGFQISGPGMLAYKVRTGANSEMPIAIGTQSANGPHEGLAGLYAREEGTGGFGQACGLVMKTSVNNAAPVTHFHLGEDGRFGFGTLRDTTAKARINSQSTDFTLRLNHAFAGGGSFRPARIMLGTDYEHVLLTGGGSDSNNAIGFFTVSVSDAGGSLLERLVVDFGGGVNPGGDNNQNLGGASKRWATVYAGTGTINTSDEREKHWRGDLTDAELRAAKRIIGELGMYQWNDAVAEKGEDGARLHFGIRAQRAFAILEDEGLDWTRYAWCCLDTLGQLLPGEEPVEDQPVRFGIRPDQLAFWLIAAQAAIQADLEARIAALEPA